jgi:hypothetical protein
MLCVCVCVCCMCLIYLYVLRLLEHIAGCVKSKKNGGNKFNKKMNGIPWNCDVAATHLRVKSKSKRAEKKEGVN